jgi:hypothetical protein
MCGWGAIWGVGDWNLGHKHSWIGSLHSLVGTGRGDQGIALLHGFATENLSHPNILQNSPLQFQYVSRLYVLCFSFLFFSFFFTISYFVSFYFSLFICFVSFLFIFLFKFKKD